MPAFESEQFQVITTAEPERVWNMLTTTGIPLHYLHGMTVESDWRPGATVTMEFTGQWRLTGEVLAAERPRRLSYTLDDPPGDPTVYVTWELRGIADGTIIRLNVDEPWPLASDTDDLATAWLPVLSRLVDYLQRGGEGSGIAGTRGQPHSSGRYESPALAAGAPPGPANSTTDADVTQSQPDDSRLAGDTSACPPGQANESIGRKQTMTTTVGLGFASINIDAADPAGLADFWGKVLGRPVSPGVSRGTMQVEAPDPRSGPQMIFHPAAEVTLTQSFALQAAGKGTGGFRPTLLTDHHDQEIGRLTSLGARLVTKADHPPIRLTLLADPEGNLFNLATWQPE